MDNRERERERKRGKHDSKVIILHVHGQAIEWCWQNIHGKGRAGCPNTGLIQLSQCAGPAPVLSVCLSALVCKINVGHIVHVVFTWYGRIWESVLQARQGRYWENREGGREMIYRIY